MTAATPIFRSIMLEIERRRVALGWPQEKFSEYAGLPDRFYPKALHADAPGGRQAQWRTLQLMMDALFPGGFDIEIRARPGAVMTKNNLKAKLLQLRATTDPRSQRELMAEIGKKGTVNAAKARMEKIGPRRRKQIAKNAAIIRWAAVKAAVAQKPAQDADKCEVVRSSSCTGEHNKPMRA